MTILQPSEVLAELVERVQTVIAQHAIS